MGSALVGPLLPDITGLSASIKYTLATAFYSAARLSEFETDAKALDFMVRLNFNDITEWVAGAIAPDALLETWDRFSDRDVRVFIGRDAHAKVYAGDTDFLVGSANFTVRGLSGTAHEIMWRESGGAARKRLEESLDRYRKHLRQITREELENFVSANKAKVAALKKKTQPHPEAVLPPLQRPDRLGDFEDFKVWLRARKRDPDAQLVLARANGDGQLSGHIYRGFFGIRQFLIHHPGEWRKLSKVPENVTYRLSANTATRDTLRAFIEVEAVDEGDLAVDRWRTYLPLWAGGRQTTGGASIGNVNRMLPLMAKYLDEKLR